MSTRSRDVRVLYMNNPPTLPKNEQVQASRAAIANVIESRAFQPVFQPIVSLQDGKILGHAALTHFDDGCRADLRFREAGQVGLGNQLALATLAQILRIANQLPYGPALHINVTPELLHDDRFAPLITTANRPVVMAFSERDPINDYVLLRQLVGQVGQGVRIAVANAGADDASISHVNSLRPNEITLDRDWVRGIHQDLRRQALIRGLVLFGRSTGTTLAAEGVDFPREAEILKRLGIDRAQGDLFGTPLSAAGVRQAAAKESTATDRVAATSRLMKMLSNPGDATVSQRFHELAVAVTESQRLSGRTTVVQHTNVNT